MRKLLWFGAAALGLTAGGLLWLAHRPGSALAPMVAWCCPLAKTQQTACNRGGAANEDIPLDELPSEPVPVEDPAPVVVAGLTWPGSTPDIVISEEDPPAAAEELGPVELAIYKGKPMAPADVPANPLTMPYCEDDASPKMPYVSDAEEVETVEAKVLGTHDGEPHPGCTFKAAPLTESGPARCEIDPNHHQHYPGCPATGHCPYNGSYGPYRDNLAPYPVRQPPPARSTGREEPSETPPTVPAEPRQGVQKHETLKPVEPTPLSKGGIDTMEFRRSDGGLGDFGPGPF